MVCTWWGAFTNCRWNRSDPSCFDSVSGSIFQAHCNSSNLQDHGQKPIMNDTKQPTLLTCKRKRTTFYKMVGVFAMVEQSNALLNGDRSTFVDQEDGSLNPREGNKFQLQFSDFRAWARIHPSHPGADWKKKLSICIVKNCHNMQRIRNICSASICTRPFEAKWLLIYIRYEKKKRYLPPLSLSKGIGDQLAWAILKWQPSWRNKKSTLMHYTKLSTL